MYNGQDIFSEAFETCCICMKLTRREFIGLSLGGLSAMLTTVCGGAGIAAWMLSNRENSRSGSVPMVSTSAANRYDVVKYISKPNIMPRAEWGALPPDHEAKFEKGFATTEHPEGWLVYNNDIRDIYKTLVVHHSVIDEGEDIASLLEIQRLHRKDRQWADVAYHFFIGKQGTVYEGRAINVRGTHVAGYNTGSLGVCLIGNFMEISPTAEQLDALRLLSRWLTVRLQLTHLAGHRDFNEITVCPGDNVAPLLGELAIYAGLLFGTAGYNGPTPVAEDAEGTSRHSGCACHV